MAVLRGEGDDEREKKGGNYSKVKKDVLETAELEGFPQTEVDAWKALFHFHQSHRTADSVPNPPTVLPVEVRGCESD
eukprot:6213161-Pleurochrysis_carterae.AAC.3